METVFKYTDGELSIKHEAKSGFDSLIQKTWTHAMDSGFFKYTLKDLESKTLPGKRSFIVQLNKCRFEERRKPQPIQCLNEPFDCSKFNFTKIKEGEIMFKMLGNGIESLCLVNVCPIEFGHSLLVPKVNALQNQVLNAEAIRLGLDAILLCSDPSMRVAFNSLCAHASVNHLHSHIWYLKHELFVQKMGAEHLYGCCYEMTQHEVGGFAWQIENLYAIGTTVEEVSETIAMLVNRGVAHNVFITRGVSFAAPEEERRTVVRVLLWPRKSVNALKTENNYNIAVAELAGQVPVKGLETFEAITEEEISKAFSDIRLDDALYSSVKDGVLKILKS